MNEDTLQKASNKTKKRWRWVKILLTCVLIWMVLGTRINLNPPLESFTDPNVDFDTVIAKRDAGDYAALVPVIIDGINENAAKAHYMIAEYYEYGVPPFHVDYCNAFDHYFKAAKRGDTDAILSVARMLENGFAGYKNRALAFYWAVYAKRQGNTQADAMIYAHYLDLSEEDRTELVQFIPDFSPKMFGEFDPVYRLPMIPVIWRVMKHIVPMRICNDPTVLDHILSALD